MTELKKLKKRVGNLELAIAGIAGILSDTQPAATNELLQILGQELFDKANELGASLEPNMQGLK